YPLSPLIIRFNNGLLINLSHSKMEIFDSIAFDMLGNSFRAFQLDLCDCHRLLDAIK
ncbi:hypothetical protein L9F63_020052, partial [Diploptera punctata]